MPAKKKDWETIVKISYTWSKFLWMPFAQWVYYWHKRHTTQHKTLKLYLTYYWFYCLSGFPAFEKYFEYIATSLDNTNQQISFDDLIKLKEKEWQNALSQTSQDNDLDQAWQEYLEHKLHTEWKGRAMYLGCHDQDKALAKIQQTVFDQISLRTGNHNIDSDDAMAERDILFNRLSLKVRAIIKRSEHHKLMTGIQEFEELLSVLQITEELCKDKFTRSQVYHQLRTPCWNWSFELWEHHKNKPLAFLICSYFAPLAAEYEDAEAHNHFFGIISNKFS